MHSLAAFLYCNGSWPLLVTSHLLRLPSFPQLDECQHTRIVLVRGQSQNGRWYYTALLAVWSQVFESMLACSVPEDRRGMLSKISPNPVTLILGSLPPRSEFSSQPTREHEEYFAVFDKTDIARSA